MLFISTSYYPTFGGKVKVIFENAGHKIKIKAKMKYMAIMGKENFSGILLKACHEKQEIWIVA